jgi:hypothetical protein
VIGLVLGGVFGLLGTVVTQSNLRAASWGIDAVGLVVATVLLTLKFFLAGNDYIASGFLVFAIGEGVMLSGTAATLDGSVPAFAAGTALWSAALLLTGVPKTFPSWARLVSIVRAILFAITTARIFWGEQVLPTSSPLPFFCLPVPCPHVRRMDLDTAQEAVITHLGRPNMLLRALAKAAFR